ncbi:unnamed protein product [Kluyveromyces dobzhanskii CBS 2104]|uniref:Protein-serine/threonine kinase n=1 Tax=Kluyveromyces dobzhanskii CBS 2104 TaxID=1427455 RepID=A0A0A8L865_9SACH|nr:unnamed protein product [Kluyveromyces dobzhanskii CBS 2104]
MTVCNLVRKQASTNARINYRFLSTQRFPLLKTHHKRAGISVPSYNQGKSSNELAELNFQQLYHIRSNIQHLIKDYSSYNVPKIDWAFLLQYHAPLQDNEKYFLTIKTLNLLLTLTSRRLASLQELPYIAMVNPNIEQSNKLYLKTLESLLAIEYPYDLYDTKKIQTLTEEFLNDHQDTLLTLSNGLQEVSRFYNSEHIFKFLNTHLHDRILMKLLTTNYLKLLEQNSSRDVIGVIHKDLHIADLITRTNEFVNDLTFIKYDKTVSIKIVEGADVKFSYIPTDLEYILQELLKNSSRAHIENKVDKDVEVTIVKNDDQLEIRIRDFGGGINPEVEDRVFDYSYSTTEKKEKNQGMSDNVLPGQEVQNVAGMGFGLPMCKAYLELFHGTLDIQSLWGWGTDVYIRLHGPPAKLFNK